MRSTCATIGCKAEATKVIDYHYRGEPQRTRELVCTPCADGALQLAQHLQDAVAHVQACGSALS